MSVGRCPPRIFNISRRYVIYLSKFLISGLSEYTLANTYPFTWRALSKNLRVLSDSSTQLALAVTVAIMAVLVLPPNESCSKRVNFDYR